MFAKRLQKELMKVCLRLCSSAIPMVVAADRHGLPFCRFTAAVLLQASCTLPPKPQPRPDFRL